MPVRGSTVLKRILFGIGVGGWILSFVLAAYIPGHRPRGANPDSGRVYAYNIHGGIYYLTRIESLVMNWLPNASFLVMVVTGLMGFDSRYAINKRKPPGGRA